MKELTLCQHSHVEAVDGACPTHGGDACLRQYVQAGAPPTESGTTHAKVRPVELPEEEAFLGPAPGGGSPPQEEAIAKLRDMQQEADAMDYPRLAADLGDVLALLTCAAPLGVARPGLSVLRCSLCDSEIVPGQPCEVVCKQCNSSGYTPEERGV